MGHTSTPRSKRTERQGETSRAETKLYACKLRTVRHEIALFALAKVAQMHTLTNTQRT